MLVGKMVGNSVAPPVATQVMLAARDAGLLDCVAEAMSIPCSAWSLDLRGEAARLVASVDAPKDPMSRDRWDDEAWQAAASKTKKKAMLADSGRKRVIQRPRHP
jgi:hypothetical protein